MDKKIAAGTQVQIGFGAGRAGGDGTGSDGAARSGAIDLWIESDRAPATLIATFTGAGLPALKTFVSVAFAPGVHMYVNVTAFPARGAKRAPPSLNTYRSPVPNGEAPGCDFLQQLVVLVKT
jgi:hypothetical protein